MLENSISGPNLLDAPKQNQIASWVSRGLPPFSRRIVQVLEVSEEGRARNGPPQLLTLPSPGRNASIRVDPYGRSEIQVGN